MNAFWLDVILNAALIFSLTLVVLLHRYGVITDRSVLDRVTERTDQAWRQWVYPSQLMRQAGIMPDAMLPFYWPGKVIPSLLAPLALLEWQGLQQIWPLLLLSVVVGFFLIDLWLLRRRNRRRSRILYSLSFFVDLLRAYLSTGFPVAEALDCSARFGLRASHPLAREVALACAELHAGQSLRQALRTMERRCGVKELQQLAAVLEVGTQAGAPILETLDKQSRVLREKQRTLVVQLMNRKSMEMLLPLGLVSMPMFFVLVIFPAGAQLYDTLQLIKQLL